MKGLCLALGLGMLVCWPVLGAEITVVPTGTDVPLVVVSGETEVGDAERFRQVTKGLPYAAVLLEGPGGMLMEGIEIGRTIAERGFATGVAPDAVCASACALAWAAGVPRFMAPNALIGFHAAWDIVDDQVVTSGVGNALVGAYLHEIGFPQEGIVFATAAGPDGIEWLNLMTAQLAGIDVLVLDSDGSVLNSPEQPDESLSLRLPSGYWWIVLASAEQPAHLPAFGEPVASLRPLTVSTQSGSYGLVVGPFDEGVARQLVSDWGQLPGMPSDI